jgi:Protein phosphatase 2C
MSSFCTYAHHCQVPSVFLFTAGPQQWAGCTALVSLVYGNHLYVANAGDCRAVLCRNGEAVRLMHCATADH